MEDRRADRDRHLFAAYYGARAVDGCTETAYRYSIKFWLTYGTVCGASMLWMRGAIASDMIMI